MSHKYTGHPDMPHRDMKPFNITMIIVVSIVSIFDASLFAFHLVNY